MAKDIYAIFQSLKSHLKIAESAAKSGYSSVQDKGGVNRVNSIISKTDHEATEDAEKAFTPSNDKQITLTTKNIPTVTLTAITSEFYDIMDFIQAYLIRGDNIALFGSLLLGIEMTINFAQNGLIDLTVKNNDVILSFNPFYITEKITINEVIAETLNMMTKYLYLHPIDFANKNPEKDDIKHNNLVDASSIASTDVLLHDFRKLKDNNNLKLRNEITTRSDIEEELGKSLNGLKDLEYYFSAISTYRKKDEMGKNDQNNQFGGSPSAGDLSIPSNPVSSGNTQQWENISNPDHIENKMISSIDNAFNSLNEKQRGLLPGSIQEYIKDINKPPYIPWQKEFKNMVGIVPSGKTRSSMKLDRRQPNRLDLRGTKPNRLVRVVAAIDTSGSMSDEDIAYVFNEIFAILKDYKTEVTIIECDAAIGRVYIAKKRNQVDTKVTGRGGTSFIPVIDYINSHKFKDAVMIYFTDGGGDYSIPKPKTFRNLWVVLEDEKYLSVEVPYGKVKALRKGQKNSRR